VSVAAGVLLLLAADLLFAVAVGRILKEMGR